MSRFRWSSSLCWCTVRWRSKIHDAQFLDQKTRSNVRWCTCMLTCKLFCKLIPIFLPILHAMLARYFGRMGYYCKFQFPLAPLSHQFVFFPWSYKWFSLRRQLVLLNWWIKRRRLLENRVHILKVCLVQRDGCDFIVQLHNYGFRFITRFDLFLSVDLIVWFQNLEERLAKTGLLYVIVLMSEIFPDKLRLFEDVDA